MAAVGGGLQQWGVSMVVGGGWHHLMAPVGGICFVGVSGEKTSNFFFLQIS